MNKKLYTLIVAALILCGCGNPYPKYTANNGQQFDVINIDNCEYFYLPSAYGSSLCHKGNCTNCAAHSIRLITDRPDLRTGLDGVSSN
jgi:hypothetical protein